MALPDGSNIRVYQNQAAVTQAAAVLGTSSGAAPGSSPGSSPQTAPQRIGRAIAGSPAHRQGRTNVSRRIVW
jgi:hypothetical protein